MPRLFVDNLTVIDCSILDPKRGLIGASWSVDIELAGELDKQSMVFDFAKVKRSVKQWIDSTVDHKLLVPALYQGISLSATEQDNVDISFISKSDDHIKHSSPQTALCVIQASKITRKNVTEFMCDGLARVLPSNVQEIKIKLSNESTAGNYYTYSHGLKKHDGNCQRIAHGHRSKIEIWKNGRRSAKLERNMSKRWQDIYLGTSDDVSEYAHSQIRFGYTTDQGVFSIELPEDRVHLMQCDTTVECIAEHVVELLEQEMPKDQFKVRAYEGIAKGAIAESA